MKAIILAAGRGSRMKGFTAEQPKCMTEVAGKPILTWVISALEACGVDDIIIVTGYKAEMLSGFGVRTVHNPLWEKTNMVASLLSAIEDTNEPVLVSYSDILYTASTIAPLCQSDQPDIRLLYNTDWRELWEARFEDPTTDAESFKINKNGLIVEIGQAVESLDLIQGQYMGLMYFSSKACNWIKRYTVDKDLSSLDMTMLIQGLIEKKYPVHGTSVKGGWAEIDTPSDLNVANQLYQKGQLSLESIN